MTHTETRRREDASRRYAENNGLLRLVRGQASLFLLSVSPCENLLPLRRSARGSETGELGSRTRRVRFLRHRTLRDRCFAFFFLAAGRVTIRFLRRLAPSPQEPVREYAIGQQRHHLVDWAELANPNNQPVTVPGMLGFVLGCRNSLFPAIFSTPAFGCRSSSAFSSLFYAETSIETKMKRTTNGHE